MTTDYKGILLVIACITIGVLGFRALEQPRYLGANCQAVAKFGHSVLWQCDDK